MHKGLSSAKFAQDDDTDWEDRIVWQRGKLLPDGKYRVVVLTRQDRRSLLKQFGLAYVRDFLKKTEAELKKWGVN